MNRREWTGIGVDVNGREFIENLMTRGRYHFTTEEVMETMDSSADAARAVVRRLRDSGKVATPHRSFHVIVPPEYRSLGCLPADQFIPHLMDHLGESYYAALLTAAMYHGAAHQQPQVFQVMVRENRPDIECGRVRVWFHARKDLEEVPVESFNTPRGETLRSTPEATAVDLVGYVHAVGGLNRVATVLTELAEKLDGETLAAIGPEIAPITWLQRLGYLLDFTGADDVSSELADHVDNEDPRVTPLSPAQDRGTGAPRNDKWRVAVNQEVQPDL